MSEPTIRLPLRLHHNVREDYAHTGILDAAGEQTMVGKVVSLVNAQAERIWGLEQTLHSLMKESMAILAFESDLRAFAGNTNVSCFMRRINEARAALDEAGKEGA
jgi:hypothetical protein